MIGHPPARHLLRAKDLIDARYRSALDVPALAGAAHLSPAHFSREFRKAFGETPHPATYEELKGNGVEFTQEPMQQPYGIDDGFRDPSGNHMRIMRAA